MGNDLMRSHEVTIMVVDDDDVDAIGITRALKKLKILNPVVRARDGLEGLAILRQPDVLHKPYIVLLDINMPRMNGLEMLSALRNDPSLSSTVVFMLTTSKIDEDKISAYKQHVAGYIVKTQVEDCFMRVTTMLDQYWRVVELPYES
jgi:CheY-like chemotaxis protein